MTLEWLLLPAALILSLGLYRLGFKRGYQKALMDERYGEDV